ncbi:MAG: alpha/beta hydrolase [Acidobacteriota bacterium]
MTFLLDGPAGPLEALYSRAVHPLGWVALVCHPHPVFGGTMHNRVVYRTAKAFLAAGAHVLRFNFRGVGASRGGYDGGIGEQADTAAALHYLQAHYPHMPIVVAGFSFGAWVGFQAALYCSQVKGLLGVGVPSLRFDFSFLYKTTLPKWIVQGDSDEFGPASTVESLLTHCQEPKGLTFISQSNHFFDGHQTELADALATAVAWLQRQMLLA